MAPEQSTSILRQLRRRYVRAKLGLYALQSAAMLVLGATLLWKWQTGTLLLMLASFAILAAAALYFGLRLRSLNAVSEEQVARHLNRRYPTLEDSTELLLQEPRNLMQRLQQQKTAAALRELHLEQEQVYTLHPIPTYIVFGLALVLSAGILCLPAGPLQGFTTSPAVKINFPNAPQALADTATMISDLYIMVTPPAYTGKKAYKADSPNLRVEEGATISWRVRTNRPAKTLQLELSEQPPQNFKVATRGYTFSRSLTHAALYTINLNGRKSFFYTIDVIPDEAPAIQIKAPREYTEIRLGEPQQVLLKAILTDDYGIREADMVATVAKGTGEAVKFQEEKITLALQGSSKSSFVSQTLNLQKLGMSFGDELYFYLQAWDNHRGYTRSETYFVQIEDTAIVEATFDMTAGVNPVPEYFRSQRQIIIDTEKLISEQKALSQTAFNDKSNSIGIDQKLLRLRYGKFLGEEAESGIGPGGGTPEGEHSPEDGHDHASVNTLNNAQALLDPYIHKHDQEDEATIFEPAIKAKLKGALAQMWDAELRLRTSKPKEALPYEYKALRMLKDVQQSQRAYVAKTGFEAPPLKEPELRLTGELNKITPLSEKQDIEVQAKLPHIRSALAWLGRYRQTGLYQKQDAQALELAGQELAQQVLGKPGQHLRALQDLRQLVVQIRAGEQLCASCLTAVERALVALLPPAPKSPQPHKTTRSSLAQEYMRQLKQNTK